MAIWLSSSSPDLSENINLLVELAEEPFLYCPNPGNAGDSAIAGATYMAFAQFGCQFEVIDDRAAVAETSGRVVVYGGGGNFVSLYRNARTFIERHHRTAKRLILLPHTINGNEDILSQLGSNVCIACRELASYDHVLRHAVKANAIIAHDMAFMIDINSLIKYGESAFWPVLSSGDLVVRNAKRNFRSMAHKLLNITHPFRLFAYRGDLEKTDVELPFSNIDVSQAFSADSMSERDSIETLFRLVRYLSSFTEVHTNRLHVCILSLLLGKIVHFYANSYGKNSSVYDHSIRGVFETVIWHD